MSIMRASKAAFAARRAASANAAVIRSIPSRSSSLGLWPRRVYGIGDAANSGHAPSRTGRSRPSRRGLVAPLAPACPINAMSFVEPPRWIRSMGMDHASACGSVYRPGVPGVMRPSAETAMSSERSVSRIRRVSAVSLSRSIPYSWAFQRMFDFPASSETRTRRRFPISSGLTCS